MSMDLYLRFAAALVFVVALIAFIGWVARRTGLGSRLPRAAGKQRRVGIVEVLPLDAKRRLVLVRRDEVEHLLLVGPGSDVVVEHNIATAGPGSPRFETLLKSDAEPEAAA